MYYLLILAVGIERVAELVVSNRNAAWSFAQGGKEFGRPHYSVMVAIHTALLIGCVVEPWALHRPFIGWLGWPMLVVVALSQVLRWWCITSLGPRWNTRVIVLPEAPLVKRGPYRGGGRRLRATAGAHCVADCRQFHDRQRDPAVGAPAGGERRAGLLMTTYDADLLIVGGGPAGLATALYARRQGLSVIVAEPREGPIDKACGEGLMPGGLAELTSLGVDPAGMPLRGIAYVAGEQAKYSRAEARFRTGPGRGVLRTTLHAELAARAKEQDTEWIQARVRSVQQDAHGVTAAGVRTKWLVGADGLHSAVRRAVGINATAGTPRRYGVRWHYRVPAWSEFVEVYWSRWGEAYVTPVEPDLVGVAILSGGRPDLAWFPRLAERLEGARHGQSRGCGPLRQVVSRRVAGRVLLVGDAAGYEDALTGEGISLAVKQAGAVVDAIVDEAPSSYEQAWQRITRNYRLLTRGLVLATTQRNVRRAIVPAGALLPKAFACAVNILAQ
jgi:flavin-dependent dehydrogenase